MRTKDIYEATQWEPGDVITYQKMQKIEDELEKHSMTLESTLDNSVWFQVTKQETPINVSTYSEIKVSNELMYWCQGRLVDGVVDETYKNALVTRDIQYSNKTITIKTDPTNYHITVAFYKKNESNNTFILNRQTGSSVAGMICIPRGIYYRLSFNALQSAEASFSLLDAYTIRESEDLFWYGSTSTVGTIAIFPRSDTLITPEKQWSGRGLKVRCLKYPIYKILWFEYETSNPYDGIKVQHGDYSNEVQINPGCWYKLIIKNFEDNLISIKDMEEQLVWERAEEVDPSIATAGITALTTVEHGEIPSYYTYTDSTHNPSYIAGKAAAINNLYSNTRVQFAFITDYHVNGYTSRGGQTGHSDTLLKYLADNTLVNMCVNGGDVVNEGSGWTGTVQNKVEFRNLMRDTCAKLRVPGMVTYFVAGNHDGGTHGGSGKAKLITAEELYAVSGLQALRGHVIVDQTCPLQYYWDDPIHNVRYIVGALGLNNSAGTNLGTIVTEQTTEEAFAFIAAALRTAPANCGIIIFNHMIIQTATGKTISEAITPYGNITLLADLVDAYNARSSDYKVGSYTTSQSNFSNCTGRVLAIIGGHSHIDYSYTTTNGVPIIVTTTDNAGGQLMLDNNNNTVVNAQRIDGNTTDFTVEQAFDVFTIDVPTGQIWATRIGGGADRTWNVTGANS